jgi:hypothetical protein
VASNKVSFFPLFMRWRKMELLKTQTFDWKSLSALVADRAPLGSSFY